MVFTAARFLVPRAPAGPYRDSEHTAHRALHSSVLPAFFGFCPPRGRQSIGDFIMEKGLCCGVNMAYFVLKALCRPGRPADAYRLTVNDGEHLRLNMCARARRPASRHGARTERRTRAFAARGSVRRSRCRIVCRE